MFKNLILTLFLSLNLYSANCTQRDFMEASMNGYLEAVEECMLSEDIYINKGLEQTSPNALMLSSYFGHIDIVKALIEGAKAKVNSRAKHKKTSDLTPLMFASFSQNLNLDILKTLIKYGARVDDTDSNKNTSLMFVVQNKSKPDVVLESVKYLINSAEANVDLKNSNLRTAYMLSAKAGNLEVLKILDSNHIDLRDKNFQTALMLSVNVVDDEHYEVVKYLLEQNASVNIKDIKGDTALHLAIEKKNIEIVKELVKNGADINAVNKKGETPLIIVSRVGDYKIAKFLIENGANVYSQNLKEETPIMVATKYQHPEIVDLLTFNLEINKRSDDGNTALLRAVKDGKVFIVNQLLNESLIDIDSTDTKGYTPLMVAIEKASKAKGVDSKKEEKYLNIARTLVTRGANSNIKTDYGWNAMQMALDNGYNELAKYMVYKFNNMEEI